MSNTTPVSGISFRSMKYLCFLHAMFFYFCATSSATDQETSPVTGFGDGNWKLVVGDRQNESTSKLTNNELLLNSGLFHHPGNEALKCVSFTIEGDGRGMSALKLGLFGNGKTPTRKPLLLEFSFWVNRSAKRLWVNALRERSNRTIAGADIQLDAPSATINVEIGNDQIILVKVNGMALISFSFPNDEREGGGLHFEKGVSGFAKEPELLPVRISNFQME